MQAGLLCTASRDYGPEAAAETVEFFLKNMDSFIGIDLAGNEVQFPCRLFAQAFAPARQVGAKITIHAGEASGPDNVWEAIDLLGARRIGHGVKSIEDANLLKYLKENSICLEICPTSNWLTQSTPRLEQHPLPQLLRQGVPVCVNTDDPGIFGYTLPSELAICREKLGMTEDEIQQCIQNGSQFSFL
jgi:adenosine deaminase